ncbi:hypothetical protein D0Z67_11130 [Streptomyces seoulensis]|uniref:DUF7847 domain-containing protein n=1 Tax=Streptomyces seoulensis TaxID=73044 RepID=A0A4P6TTZ8_STRSO|nr:membrane protein [Streptomyces seoulensis]QBJ90800.1 hypothetical protein D0Z67_11130 [Streptomyces seoulensis]
MSDTPGWASPGPDPSSEERQTGAAGAAEPTPADRPAPAAPAAQPGEAPQSPDAQPSDAKGPGAKGPDAPEARWAEGQPPPGQWSAPTGPPAPGQAPPPPPPGSGWGAPPPAGWGGPPAWGNGWGGPPPAAKPGVIPLRPLSIGEILDGAISTMRAYWRTVLGISLTVAVLTQLCALLLQGVLLKDTTSTLSDPDVTPTEALRSLGSVTAGALLIGVVSVVGTIVATALLTIVTSRAVLGKPISIGEAWRESRGQLLKLLGLLMLLALITGGVLVVGMLPGLVLGLVSGFNAPAVVLLVLGILAAVVVMIWLTVRFSLASPALMLERQGVWKSLSRSAKLVQGSWWRVLGVQFLAGLIANMVSWIAVLPFTFIAFTVNGENMTALMGTGAQPAGWSFLLITGIGSVIGATLTMPVKAGVTVLLYIDQRIRREALDLELARAAGVQGYAPGATTGPVPGS